MSPPGTNDDVFAISWLDEAGVPNEREFPVRSVTSITLGRMPTSGIVLNHPTISRQHARIEIRNGCCFLIDTGSTSGTRVDGQRITVSKELTPVVDFGLGAVMLTLTRRRPLPKVAMTTDPGVLDSSGTIFRPIESTGPVGQGTATVDATEATRFKHLLSEIGKALVSARELPQVLERVVDIVFDNIPAERAVLLLRDSEVDPLTPRVARAKDGSTLVDATISRTIVSTVMHERVAMLGDDALQDQRFDMAGSIHSLNIRSFMCAPLWNRNDVIGVLHVDTSRSRRFVDDDLTLFTALANYAAVAIEQARLSGRLLEETRRRERLQRYHSPSVVSRILNATEQEGMFDAQIRDVTVMFADLVGFTSLSEHMKPADVASTLNEFFREMTDVIFDHQGTLDKYLGDGLLAVFGAPLAQGDHAANALRAAVGMRRALKQLNLRHAGSPLRVRIAVHSGPVLTGDIGSPRRREFTVLGDTVNTASRLEGSVAESDQIVTTSETLSRAGGVVKTRALGPVTLRGRHTPVEVFAVED